MNESSRAVIPSASSGTVESAIARVLPDGQGLGLAVVFTAYLLVCLAARVANHARTAVRTWITEQLRAQRRIRRMLVTVGIFGVAITLGISAGGSTYALWNVGTPIGAANVSTGVTGITVNGSGSYTVPGLTTTQLLPGLSAVSPTILTILNTGTTPLSVSVGAAVFDDPSSPLAQNNNLAVSLFQSASCSQSVDGSGTAAWTTPTVLAAGASLTACLQMTLSSAAPASVQSLSASFTLPIVGTQVRNNP
jgi:hypothetical protein